MLLGGYLQLLLHSPIARDHYLHVAGLLVELLDRPLVEVVGQAPEWQQPLQRTNCETADLAFFGPTADRPARATGYSR